MPGDQRSHVLVVGDVLVDVLVSHKDPLAGGSDAPARIRRRGGGSAANTACWLASMGEPTKLMAAVGDDQIGAWAVAELDDVGVELVGPVLEGEATGTCITLLSADGERTRLVDRGANDRLPLAAVVGGLDPIPGWVHLSGFAILHEGSRNAGRGALSAGLAAAVPVSVDAGSRAPIKAVGAEAFLQWIDGATILFANDAEVEALGGAAAVLAHVRAIAVKHGAAGATWSDGTQTVVAEGFEVDVVDPTGAGDAFAAGWIGAARRGDDPEACLAEAVRVGAIAITHDGARPARDP